MNDPKLRPKGTIPVRRLQPLVEYIEVPVFAGSAAKDLIPTNEFAERLHKAPLDPTLFRSGI